MAYDFDCVIDRAGTNATKLQKYADSNILPFWIADMDFAVPDFILEPLRERLDHPIVGYTKRPDSSPWLCKTGSRIITAGKCQRNGLFGYQVWYRGLTWR